MAFSDEDRANIKKFGLSDETIDFVLSQNSKDRADADTAGVDSKESEEETELIEKEADETVEVEETTEEVEEETEEVEDADETDSDGLDADEVASAFVDTMGAITALSEFVKELESSNKALALRVKELERTDAEKIADLKDATPWASQQELMRKSVVTREDARIDGRTSIAKSGPKETEPEVRPIVGIPMVDQFLTEDAA